MGVSTEPEYYRGAHTHRTCTRDDTPHPREKRTRAADTARVRSHRKTLCDRCGNIDLLGEFGQHLVGVLLLIQRLVEQRRMFRLAENDRHVAQRSIDGDLVM